MVLPWANKEVCSRGCRKLSFVMTGFKPGEDTVPLSAMCLSVRDVIPAFKVPNSLEVFIIAAFTVISC